MPHDRLWMACKDCGGTGKVIRKPRRDSCPKCGGYGMIGGWFVKEKPCPKCDGYGAFDFPEQRVDCFTCHGKKGGYEWVRK
jgi:DnaJ-class molecular chaperone